MIERIIPNIRINAVDHYSQTRRKYRECNKNKRYSKRSFPSYTYVQNPNFVYMYMFEIGI